MSPTSEKLVGIEGHDTNQNLLSGPRGAKIPPFLMQQYSANSETLNQVLEDLTTNVDVCEIPNGASWDEQLDSLNGPGRIYQVSERVHRHFTDTFARKMQHGDVIAVAENTDPYRLCWAQSGEYFCRLLNMGETIRVLDAERNELRTALKVALERPHRRRLPDTRRSVTHKFTIKGDQNDTEGYVTVGLYDDGRPGELFIKIAKAGTSLRGAMDTVGILSSMLLQYGAEPETLARKFEYTRFEPSGWTKNSEIHHASSVVDYIFRWLGTQFSDTYKHDRVPHPDDGETTSP